MRPVLSAGPSVVAFDVVFVDVACPFASYCCARLIEAPYAEPAADAEADGLGAAPVLAESARFEKAPLAKSGARGETGLSSATPKTSRR